MTNNHLEKMSNGQCIGQCIVLWCRHILRLHDHPALIEAVKKANELNMPLVCVWVFEKYLREKDQFGFARIRSRRALYLLETVQELRSQLRALGNELITLDGDPVTLLPQFSVDVNAHTVFTSRHVAVDERRQMDRLKDQLNAQGVSLQSFWGHTLYRQEELPFPLKSLPSTFTRFRKIVEKYAQVHPPHEAPTYLPPPITTSCIKYFSSTLDTLYAEWLEYRPTDDQRAQMTHLGGESHGKSRVNEYLWKTSLIEKYKETRNELIGSQYSSKLSAWLSVGALSPRMIWHEVLRYESERISNQSTYWLRFELLWREYFQWVALRYGSALFQVDGLCHIMGTNPPSRKRVDHRHLSTWIDSRTGDEFVNAGMRELKLTGDISNRARQNVASYLVHQMGVDWRMGASYFESTLIDYDPASNWGNWAYIAGVGNDPRAGRAFDTVWQAERYDPKGAYRRRWSDDSFDSTESV